MVTAAAYALVAMAVPAERIFDFGGGLQTVAAVLPVSLAGLVVFAGLYALYAGMIVLVAASILIAPAFHRFLHRFHLEEDEKRRKA